MVQQRSIGPFVVVLTNGCNGSLPVLGLLPESGRIEVPDGVASRLSHSSGRLESNSPTAIERRLRAGKLSTRAVWLMVPARWAFAALTFALAALVANLASQPDPLSAAGSWWMVDGTLVDLACFAALATLTLREGIGRGCGARPASPSGQPVGHGGYAL